MTGDQLGFGAMLEDAARDNAAWVFERETAHLPETWDEALKHHHKQIADHHAAMLENDFEAATAIRKEAHLLAKKLNGGNPGILASDDAPGCKLDKQAAATEGTVPLWGQSGLFEIEVSGAHACVEMGGMFGIGATAMPYLGFSVRAAEASKPFLSSTGYRSFLGCTVEPEQGMTPEGFVRRVIDTYIERELRGKLVPIMPEHN